METRDARGGRFAGVRRAYWGKRSPFGKRIRPGIDGPWFTIVGIVGNIHLHALEKPAEQSVYFPLTSPSADGVGIYGVMAYGVSLRDREIGVRMALGARPSDVTHMISRQGLALAGVGVAIGLGASLGVMRLLRGLLYDISPTDPLTLVGSVAVLLGVALLASWLPARRAAGIDPGTVLRGD